MPARLEPPWRALTWMAGKSAWISQSQSELTRPRPGCTWGAPPGAEAVGKDIAAAGAATVGGSTAEGATMTADTEEEGAITSAGGTNGAAGRPVPTTGRAVTTGPGLGKTGTKFRNRFVRFTAHVYKDYPPKLHWI